MLDTIIPHKTPWVLKAFSPKVYEWKGPEEQGQVYLSFDDGPVPEATPWVLDVLSEYNIPATFFVVGGNLEKHPDLYKEVVEQGHDVGNHTFNHLKGSKTETSLYLENIEQANAIMEEVSPGSTKKKLLRPPYGRIRNAQGLLLAKQYRIIMWDVLTHDYNGGMSSERIFKRSLKATTSGSIVVFHDSPKSIVHLKKVLRPYLDTLLEKGHSFGRL